MRNPTARVASWSIGAAVLLAACLAGAGDLPEKCPARPEDKESARALASTWFKKAEKAYSEEDYAGAVGFFRCSLSLVEHPATYYNAAQAALLADDKRSALEFFRRNLEMAPDGKSAAEVELEIAELEQQLEPQPQPAPEPTPEPALEPSPEVPPEPAAEADEPEPEPGDDVDPLKTTATVMVVVGAVGVVAGVVFQGLAGKFKADSETAQYLTQFEEAEDKMNTFQKGAYAGFFAGGAILATGVIMLVVSGGEDEGEPAAMTLAPAPAGVVLSGSF